MKSYFINYIILYAPSYIIYHIHAESVYYVLLHIARLWRWKHVYLLYDADIYEDIYTYIYEQMYVRIYRYRYRYRYISSILRIVYICYMTYIYMKMKARIYAAWSSMFHAQPIWSSVHTYTRWNTVYMYYYLKPLSYIYYMKLSMHTLHETQYTCIVRKLQQRQQKQKRYQKKITPCSGFIS